MDYARRVFSLNIRALKFFRIALGLIIATWAFERLLGAEVFFSDLGFWPRSADHSPLNLFSLSGSVWWAAFLLAFLCGLGLLLAARVSERATSAMLLWLIYSVRYRNDWIANGGDNVLLMLAFWSAVLPSTRGKKNEEDRFSLVTVLFVFQIAFFYASAGWMKSPDEWWYTGEAGRLALLHPAYSAVFGQYLLNFPTLLRFGTRAVFLLERFGWLLFFWPRARLATCLIYASMHLGFGMVLNLRVFPWADFAALLPLLPARGRALWARFDLSAAVAAAFFAIVLWSMTGGLLDRELLPRALRPLAYFVGAHQKWQMFAPTPPFQTGWWVVRGKTKSGLNVDPVFRSLESQTSATIAEERPPDAFARWPSRLWGEFFAQMGKHERVQKFLARYLCVHWDDPDPLEQVEFIYYEQTVVQSDCINSRCDRNNDNLAAADFVQGVRKFSKLLFSCGSAGK